MEVAEGNGSDVVGERELAEAYDRVPYLGQPFRLSHPRLLSGLATLHGMSPARPDECRVLELGCGDGGNLIPMACSLPGSEFIGIDLSEGQIERGRRCVSDLGITNVRLDAGSIADLTADAGQFDYVIAHGVYSWVQDSLKAKILEICSVNLAPEGMAYVSYNALPGWLFNRAMRDLMLFHTRDIVDSEARVRAVLQLMEELVDGTDDSTDAHHVALRYFSKRLRSHADLAGYISHEYMEVYNDAFYLRDFVGAAEARGLQYVCDADHAMCHENRFPATAYAKAKEFSRDRLEVEQYLDFIRNTPFRRTLLCHGGLTLDSSYSFERIRTLFAGTDAELVESEPGASVVGFQTDDGRRVGIGDPSARAALEHLCRARPATVPVETLIEAVSEAVSREDMSGPAQIRARIGHVLYSLWRSGLVDLFGAPRNCTGLVSEKPEGFGLARYQAAGRYVTTMAHRSIAMDDEVASLILRHLDGTHDREALLRILTDALESGEIKLPPWKSETKPEPSAGDRLARLVDLNLDKMAEHALLVG